MYLSNTDSLIIWFSRLWGASSPELRNELVIRPLWRSCIFGMSVVIVSSPLCRGLGFPQRYWHRYYTKNYYHINQIYSYLLQQWKKSNQTDFKSVIHLFWVLLTVSLRQELSCLVPKDPQSSWFLLHRKYYTTETCLKYKHSSESAISFIHVIDNKTVLKCHFQYWFVLL